MLAPHRGALFFLLSNRYITVRTSVFVCVFLPLKSASIDPVQGRFHIGQSFPPGKSIQSFLHGPISLQNLIPSCPHMVMPIYLKLDRSRKIKDADAWI